MAREIEAAKHILGIKEQIAAAEGGPPRAWQVVFKLLRRVVDSELLVRHLSKHVGQGDHMTLPEVVYDSDIRNALDWDLPEEMVDYVADAMNKQPEEIRA